LVFTYYIHNFVLTNQKNIMEISAYIKTKDKVQSFENSYKSVNGILYLFSFLGNVASIIFAYFFLSNILSGVTDNFWGKAFVITLISFLALTAFELLKRFLFKQTAKTIIKSSNKTEKYIIGGLSFLIVCTSFYLSISGAHTLSDKTQKIADNTQKKIDLVFKSITADYQIKIDKINKQIDFYNQMIATGTKSRALRMQYNQMIIAATAQLEKLNLEKTADIKTAKTDIISGTKITLDNSFANVRAFLILSTFIELIILIGVAFDTYYNDRVFNEFDSLVTDSRKHRNFVLYNRLLNAVFNNGKLTKDENILTSNTLSKIIKAIDLQVTDNQIKNFYTLLVQVKVIESPIKRKALMTFAEAKKALKDYYKF